MRSILSQIRRFVNFVFSILNRARFRFYNISFGKNLIVHGKIGLNISKSSSIKIGDNFYSSNGRFINPISRNIQGCIASGDNAEINIGDNVAISSTTIWARKKITLGNNIKIGGDSLILDSDYHALDYLSRRFKETDVSNNAEIRIEDDVLIGARCVILKGVTIGARSIIGAGSIVTKSIPADTIAAGNPCKVIKSIN